VAGHRWPDLGSEQVLFHGSLENADRIHRELAWTPGAFCSTVDFACSAWWPAVSDQLLSDRYLFTTVGALTTNGPPPDFGPRVFVRPDSCLKPFSGRVLDADRVTLQALDHSFYYDDEDLPVVVAPEVGNGEEFRFVIAGRRVLAGSSYVADGRLEADALDRDHAAWAYASSLLDRIPAPETVFVLDVCETAQGWRLVELNPFSGADFYGCDREAITSGVRALL
jgi:hypothetical protein